MRVKKCLEGGQQPGSLVFRAGGGKPFGQQEYAPRLRAVVPGRQTGGLQGCGAIDGQFFEEELGFQAVVCSQPPQQAGVARLQAQQVVDQLVGVHMGTLYTL